MKFASLLLFAAFASLISISHGQVLITDNFDRGTALAPAALNGSSPTFSATPETWTANSNITTDGTEAVLPSTSTPPDDSILGYIGIPGVTGSNLNVGSTYTLSFTLTPPSGSQWTAAGFGTETNTGDVQWLGGNEAGFWVLYNTTGGVAVFEDVSGAINLIGITSGVSGDAHVALTIQAGASADMLSASLNGNPLALAPSIVAVDPMTQVFISDDSASGAIKSLSLSVISVPEPSTWAMLLSSLGLLLFISRLRRKLSF